MEVAGGEDCSKSCGFILKVLIIDSNLLLPQVLSMLFIFNLIQKDLKYTLTKPHINIAHLKYNSYT